MEWRESVCPCVEGGGVRLCIRDSCFLSLIKLSKPTCGVPFMRDAEVGFAFSGAQETGSAGQEGAVHPVRWGGRG